MSNKALLLFSITANIVLFEVGLRLFTPFPIHDQEANRSPHDALGYVMSSTFPQIDHAGFRNSAETSVAKTVDIVAIGDSHTYSYNVSSENSWPSALGKKTGLSVYNYGVGGYGLLQYVFVFEDALRKKPKFILFGLFLTNDLVNYCDLATRDYWQPIIAAAKLNLEFCQHKNSDEVISGAALVKLTIKSTAIGSAAAYLKRRYLYQFRSAESGILFDLGQHDVWLERGRLREMARQTDTNTAVVAEGIKAAQYFFRQMARDAAESGIRIGILLIPSRERVLLQQATRKGVHDDQWRQVVGFENHLVDEFQRFFRQLGVPVVDALPTVQQALDTWIRGGPPVYPVADGHPLKAGYDAYAQAAHTLLATQP